MFLDGCHFKNLCDECGKPRTVADKVQNLKHNIYRGNSKRCGWFSLRARHRDDAQYKKLVDNGYDLADHCEQPGISDNSVGVMRENSNPCDNNFRQKNPNPLRGPLKLWISRSWEIY